MSCTGLALTGSGAMLLLVAVAIGLVLIGMVLVLSRRLRLAVILTMVLVAAVAVGWTPGSVGSAQAASACSSTPAANSLLITQTSNMSGLTPGGAPAAIAGIVTNTGSDDAMVAGIVVSIASVRTASGAATGPCLESDYVIVAPVMAVARSLTPGSSATFGGASIGLRNGAGNQDACKGATINLLYSTAP